MTKETSSYLINFMLVALFVILVLNFAFDLGDNYGLTQSQMTNDRISTSRLNNTLGDLQENATSWKEEFTGADNPFEVLTAAIGIVLKPLWFILTSLFGAIIIFFEIIFGFLLNLGLIPTIVLGVIGAGLLIALVFAVWRTLKRG